MNKAWRLLLVLACGVGAVQAGMLESLRSSADNFGKVDVAGFKSAAKTAAAVATAPSKVGLSAGRSYTALFATRAEAEEGMRRMVSTLSSSALILSKGIIAGEGGFMVVIDYSLQSSMNVISRYVSHEFPTSSEAYRSMEECVRALDEAKLPPLSSNVYLVKDASGKASRYYFALGFLQSWETNLREYKDTGYENEGFARRSMYETLDNLKKARIPVLGYDLTRTGAGDHGFQVDFLRNYQNEIREFAAYDLGDEGEAYRSMNDTVGNLAKAGVTVVSYHAMKRNYRVAFIIPDQRTILEYDSSAYKNAWEARSSADEAMKDLGRVKMHVLGYQVKGGDDKGYQFHVAFLGDNGQGIFPYDGERFYDEGLARREMYTAVDRLRAQVPDLAIMSYRVRMEMRGGEPEYYWTVDFFGRQGFQQRFRR